MSLARSIVLKTAGLSPVKYLIRKSFLFRPLVRRFIAGDTLEEALKSCEAILAKGQMVSLDYLGENTASEQEALQAKSTYIQMLQAIASLPAIQTWNANHAQSPNLHVTGDGIEPINISIKLTQCGFDQGTDFAERNLRDVLDTAKGLNNFVRVDMESSEYTERTMEIMGRVVKDYKNTGTVLQTYLYRTPKDVEQVIEWKARVRLVKGAYLEPAAVAFPEKAKVDEAYVTLGKRLMDAGTYPAFATQDAKIIEALVAYARERKIDPSRFEFQMLYGIRRDLQDKLSSEGFKVRVYVPYGDAWYPYFSRRLAERPANTLFIVKSLFKG
ncbi:MAG: proline dehydrogenase family protein [Fimbriimonas sp.]|nr:proline dehydrogenase family protein [Fimbriimonas sp.]